MQVYGPTGMGRPQVSLDVCIYSWFYIQKPGSLKSTLQRQSYYSYLQNLNTTCFELLLGSETSAQTSEQSEKREKGISTSMIIRLPFPDERKASQPL
jgi:hypothetical protein